MASVGAKNSQLSRSAGTRLLSIGEKESFSCVDSTASHLPRNLDIIPSLEKWTVSLQTVYHTTIRQIQQKKRLEQCLDDASRTIARPISTNHILRHSQLRTS